MLKVTCHREWFLCFSYRTCPTLIDNDLQQAHKQHTKFATKWSQDTLHNTRILCLAKCLKIFPELSRFKRTFKNKNFENLVYDHINVNKLLKYSFFHSLRGSVTKQLTNSLPEQTNACTYIYTFNIFSKINKKLSRHIQRHKILQLHILQVYLIRQATSSRYQA